MRAQNFLGHKNSKPKLSDQLRTSKDVTLPDILYSLLKSQDSRWIREKIEILRRLGRKKSRLRYCFAENTRLRDATNHSRKCNAAEIW